MIVEDQSLGLSGDALGGKLMSLTSSPRGASRPAVARRAGAVVAALLTVSLAFGGCGISKIVKTVSAIDNAAHNLKNLQSEIQKGENATYEATYKTTGSGSSSTITFAQEPGGKYAYIVPGTSGSGGTDFVADGKNQYECSQDSSGGSWTCYESAEPSGTSGLEGDAFFGFTGAYYVTIVDELSAVAAVEGYKVSNFNSSINGISLKCVSLSGKTNGQSENDEWCVTDDGVLGLVKYSGSSGSNGSSFEITKLDAHPSASLFEPPTGATITSSSSITGLGTTTTNGAGTTTTAPVGTTTTLVGTTTTAVGTTTTAVGTTTGAGTTTTGAGTTTTVAGTTTTGEGTTTTS
jgi:hypothetical protein